MSDYPMLISNKLHSFRNFGLQKLCFCEPKRGFLQAKNRFFVECFVTFLLTDNYILVFGTMFLTTLPLCFAFVRLWYKEAAIAITQETAVVFECIVVHFAPVAS